MSELLHIFDALEGKGWVCLLKWDGERDSKTKTVVVSHLTEDKFFRGDFHDFEQGLRGLRDWLKEQRVIWDD